MLYNDLKHANGSNKIDIYSAWEFKNFSFQYCIFNWIISVINGAKFAKFGTPLVEGHSEVTVSKILI